MSDKDLQSLVPLLHDEKTRERAFSNLVRLTSSRLYWHIRRIVLVHDDADDILQNTYIKAFSALPSFRGDASLYTWLYRIATNETLTFLSKQRLNNITTPLDYEELLISRMEADAYYDGDAMQDKFQRALLTLPEKQRMVFNLRYYDEMKYEDISRITGTSEGALKASYHIAVKKIEQFIKEKD